MFNLQILNRFLTPSFLLLMGTRETGTVWLCSLLAVGVLASNRHGEQGAQITGRRARQRNQKKQPHLNTTQTITRSLSGRSCEPVPTAYQERREFVSDQWQPRDAACGFWRRGLDGFHRLLPRTMFRQLGVF